MLHRTRPRAVLAALSLWLAGAPATAAVDAWPLYQHDEEGTTVLYPLYVHEGDFLMVAPVYYRTREARDHHLLWPLVKLSEGRLVRAAPFYFSEEEDEFTLFPLIRQTPSGTLWMLPPAYFSRTSDFSMVFPLYAHSRSDEQETWWIGTWYRHEDPHERRQGVVPLYTTREERDPHTGTTERSLSLLAWLYSREVTTNTADERIAHRRRFLALTDSLDASGRRSIGLLGLPIWERTRPRVPRDTTPEALEKSPDGGRPRREASPIPRGAW
jgi:hypothetical protein